ncbi:MAG: hypothetical protein PF549_04240, partial [Patescibacteria group bacterium]|jgi:hypothetical protein|nr:hypothetical protein [Patescibacteria group bacterium]
LILISGFVVELIKLVEARNYFPLEVFFHSYFTIVMLNLISIGILMWLSKDPFNEVVRKIKGFFNK